MRMIANVFPFWGPVSDIVCRLLDTVSRCGTGVQLAWDHNAQRSSTP